MLTRLIFKTLPLNLMAATALFSAVPTETNDLMRAEIKDMKMAMERLHFSRKHIANEDLEQLIPNYMERLDFGRLYFTKTDELQWKQRFGKTLRTTYLNRNELYPAFYMFNTFEKRVNDRIEWAKEYLQSDVDLFQDQTYTIDPEKLDWVANQKEADERWKARIKNELLNEIIPEIRDLLDETHGEELIGNIDFEFIQTHVTEETLETQLAEAKQTIIDRYDRWAGRISEMKQAEVQEDFLTELAQLYDPHSNFMSPDTSEDFGISISNELIGIGAILSDENGYCKVQELIDGGPAMKSRQIKEGDKIIGVAQDEKDFVDVVGKRLRDVVKLIRGEEDSTVRLKILPETGPKTEKIVPIVRQRIKLEEKLASAELFYVPHEDRSIPVGVIKLPNFYGPTASTPMSTRASEDVNTLITKLKAFDVEGIVLDLRTNGGGLLDEAINITGLFISSGPVVKVRNRSGNIDVSKDYDPRVAWDGPLAVLTSRYSASASEIVAGALQYYKRALVIGDGSTHGKGTVQTTFPLPISIYDMYGGRERFVRPNFLERLGRLPHAKPTSIPSMAKITIAKYYLPDGSSTQLRGVVSDIELPSVTSLMPIRESDLENPLSWDNIPGYPISSEELLSNSYPYLQPSLVHKLDSLSKKRQQSLDEFNYLNELITNYEERTNRDSVSLNLVQRLNRIYQDKETIDHLESLNDDLIEFSYDKLEVPLKIKDLTEEVIEDPVETAANEVEVDIEALDEDEDEPDSIDIHLRESVRIVSDWIEFETIINASPDDRQIALTNIGEDHIGTASPN
jgi:carboxyl-terminal processing protease